MTIPYTKAALTFRQQLQKLTARGLIISDLNRAQHQLESINYYRLSAYWYPFRQRDNATGKILDSFRPNSSLEDVITFYEFDRRLRLLIIDGIERVEVAIRTQLTYHLAHKYGPFAHTSSINFHPKFFHANWLQQIEDETTRSSEEFIQHYQREYNGFPTIPIWMLTEVMSLGALSKLYKGLQNEDKKSVSVKFNIHHKKLGDWLHTLTYVRNVCAHHGRLWNRELAIRPDTDKDLNWKPPITPTNTRVFYILLMIRFLLRNISNNNEWQISCTSLLNPVAEEDLWRVAMGMPPNWQNHPIWR